MKTYNKKRQLQLLYLLLWSVNAVICLSLAITLFFAFRTTIHPILSCFFIIFLYKVIRELIYQGFHHFGFYAAEQLEEIRIRPSYRSIDLPVFYPHTDASLKAHQRTSFVLKFIYLLLDSLLLTACLVVWGISLYQFKPLDNRNILSYGVVILFSLLYYFLWKYGQKQLTQLFSKYILSIEHGEPTFRKPGKQNQ